jgi:hypothetical protein
MSVATPTFVMSYSDLVWRVTLNGAPFGAYRSKQNAVKGVNEARESPDFASRSIGDRRGLALPMAQRLAIVSLDARLGTGRLDNGRRTLPNQIAREANPFMRRLGDVGGLDAVRLRQFQRSGR